MINKPLLQAQGLIPGGTAQIRIPAETLTLMGIQLRCTGTNFNRTHITNVRLKVGQRVIWSLSGAHLQVVNSYKNGVDNARYMFLDFAERDQAVFPVKQIGGIDLMGVLGIGEVYLELDISPSSVNPILYGTGHFEAQQGGNPLVLKYLSYPMNSLGAGRFTAPLSLRGAMIKRIFFNYAGSPWSNVSNGNLSRVELKKNGFTIFDQECLDVRFLQTHFKKVPQQNVFVYDAIVDNNHDACVTTQRQLANGSSLFDTTEFNLYFTDVPATQITAVVEVLDMVTNL